MRKATVLIVDDDPSLTLGIKDNLEIEGYHVLTAANVKAGRSIALSEKPDLVLLDVMLPDGDGITLCRQLRGQGFNKVLIMLTAKGQESDKVLGLEVGADDYVVKPFSLRELLARVNAHLRRGKANDRHPDEPVAVGVATVDFRRHEIRRNGEPLEISAKELELLKFFVMRRGSVVSRDELLTEIWGHQREVATRTIDNFIVRLRKKIEPDSQDPRYLITVHGSGYKLVEQ